MYKVDKIENLDDSVFATLSPDGYDLAKGKLIQLIVQRAIGKTKKIVLLVGSLTVSKWSDKIATLVDELDDMGFEVRAA